MIWYRGIERALAASWRSSTVLKVSQAALVHNYSSTADKSQDYEADTIEFYETFGINSRIVLN